MPPIVEWTPTSLSRQCLLLLADQLHLLLSERFGLGLPAALDLNEVDLVLDVACGTGNWAQDLAFTYKDIEVYGLDSDAESLVFAQGQARMQHLHNLLFCRGSFVGLPDLPAGMFDLVHLRCTAPRVPTAVWPLLLRDLWRLCRPGGSLCWTEVQAPVSSSPALNQLYQRGADACAAAGSTLDVTPMMHSLLLEAGWQPIAPARQTIDLSIGTRRSPPLLRLAYYAACLLEEVHPTQPGSNTEAVAALCEQLEQEMYASGFAGSCTLVSWLCRKAGEEGGDESTHSGD